MSAILAGACAAGSVMCGTVAVRRRVAAPPSGRPTVLRGDVLARTAAGRRLAVRLGRAGVPVGPGAFILLVGAASALVGGGVWWLLGTPVGGGLVGLAVAAMAGSVVASADRRHLDRLISQLPAVTQQLAGSLGAGLSLSQAIGRASRDTPAPMSDELARMSREIALGARTDDVLTAFADRHASQTVRLMVSAILVQRTVGGDLASGLTRISAQLDERGRVAREARSVTAQARMSAWLVAGLPPAGGVIVELASPGTIGALLGAGLGRTLLIATIILELLGVILVHRIARVDGGAR